MLVPHQAPGGEGLEQPTKTQPTPSPTQPSIGDQPSKTSSSSSHDTTQDSRDSLEGIMGVAGDHVKQIPMIGFFAFELPKDVWLLIIKLKTRNSEVKKKSHPVISHHKAWLRSVSRLSMKRNQEEGVCIQNRGGRMPNLTNLMPLDDVDGWMNLVQDSYTRDIASKRWKGKTEGDEASKAANAAMYDEVQAGNDVRHCLSQDSNGKKRGNMGGYKHSQLKAKSFEEIKEEEELIKKMNERQLMQISVLYYHGKSETKQKNTIPMFLKNLASKIVKIYTGSMVLRLYACAERKYPLTKETLERMLSLRLVAGTASEDAYTLLRFIQKQIDKHGSHNGREKDL
ncbi:hypothetical protein Tco_0651578 [Tanacetum coccineum]|uniref:Uncharacterized protein n=1 Tax=Tanacetum coccineum TaxID=301880 RepID=A0ABQ4WV92_9ASTR